MYYKIYPDVIFLTNLLLDYTVLAVSCRLCKITTTYLRLTIAAGIGAAWSVMVAVVGNEGITDSLTDPYSGEPVCIVEKKALAGLMQSDTFSDGITLIPYKSLGKEHGLMRLVTMDCMMVEYEGRTRQYEYPKIALYEGSLSKKGEYSMILNASSLNRK